MIVLPSLFRLLVTCICVPSFTLECDLNLCTDHTCPLMHPCQQIWNRTKTPTTGVRL